MSSSHTETIQTLLNSDFLTLDKILESLDLSGDDLLTALSDDLGDRIVNDSLFETLQTFYEDAIADETSDGTKTTIQTLLETLGSQTSGLTNFANSSTRPLNSSTVFAFANSIFSNGGNRRQSSSKISDLIDQVSETYQFSIPSNAAAFTTLTSIGERIDNGNNGSAEPLKWRGSDNGTTTVSFAFDDAFAVNGISFSQAKSLITSALSVWAKYAPLNFQEIQDPGSGDQVDILVQSNAIDGQGKTLAFAYFPTYGDITFDTAEQWTDTKFLETATHELGHSLGLDHENDVSAIMNSVLGNKFEGQAEPFLLEDDINGIRNLYGVGSGAVFTLDQGVVRAADSVAPLASNLVINGSFEDTPVEANSVGGYTKIKGWAKISGVGFQVDRRTESMGQAADGTAWIELDAYGQNATVGQNIDTLTGQDYTLSVDFTSGGRDLASTAVDVFWEGNKIDTLTGGDRGDWKNYRFSVKGSDRNVSTLAFRAVGEVDGIGGFIDNVSVLERANATVDTYLLGSALQQDASEQLFSSPTAFAPELVVNEQTSIFPDTAFLA